MDRPYLITGATGATGGETARLLLKDNYSVRAFVHRLDERAERLRDLGAEVVVGDLLNFADVRGALERVRGAYFVYPIVPGILQATGYFAQAAQEARVETIVNMSQISARRDATSHAALDHWIAERVFDWAGTPTTHLRPTLFAEWALYWSAFYKGGVLRLPFGTGTHAPIAAADQARVIARILQDPNEHQGRTYPLYGAEEMTFSQMADAIGRVLGRDIHYEQTDVVEMKAAVEKTGKHLGDFIWQHFAEIAVDHQNGIFAGTNNLVESIGHRPPQSLENFLESHRDELLAQF